MVLVGKAPKDINEEAYCKVLEVLKETNAHNQIHNFNFGYCLRFTCSNVSKKQQQLILQYAN